jgi:hypothetical protein
MNCSIQTEKCFIEKMIRFKQIAKIISIKFMKQKITNNKKARIDLIWNPENYMKATIKYSLLNISSS